MIKYKIIEVTDGVGNKYWLIGERVSIFFIRYWAANSYQFPTFEAAKNHYDKLMQSQLKVIKSYKQVYP